MTTKILPRGLWPGVLDTPSLSPDMGSGWAQRRPLTADLCPLCLTQCAEKKPEAGGPEAEPCPEPHVEALETLTRVPTAGPEGGGVRPEQPFLVLGQEEYGEHHSSIMHCRWVLAAGAGPWGKRGGLSGKPAVLGCACEGVASRSMRDNRDAGGGMAPRDRELSEKGWTAATGAVVGQVTSSTPHDPGE